MSFGASFEERVRKNLQELEAAGLRRRMEQPAGLDFSSNDYLGLARHPLLIETMAAAVRSEGCGSTGSRLLRGNPACFERLERRFADFKKTEGALFFGSGYAANLGVLATFLERTDTVFSDERNHASIVDGIRLSHARRVRFPHGDVDRVAQLLRNAPRDARKFLVTESLFSMDGDIAPLAQYAELCRETDTVLIVDEAHAVGIYGATGSGLIEETGVGDAVFMSVNTAGKALGVSGAFAAGPAWAIEFLIQRARTFIFSTAPPPPVAAAIEAAIALVGREPERRRRLLRHAALLRSLLADSAIDCGPSHSQIVPIVLGGNESACNAAAELRQEGFDVRAIRPPAVPEGTARLRVSVNAQLDESDVCRFAASLQRILQKEKACSAVFS